jgi:hypothetical protein
MAKKEETPSNDTLTKEDLKIILSIIIQSNIRASDAKIISSIIEKIETMTK